MGISDSPRQLVNQLQPATACGITGSHPIRILASFGGVLPSVDRGTGTALSVAARHGTGPSWLQPVALVPGAVCYATGYLQLEATSYKFSVTDFKVVLSLILIIASQIKAPSQT